MGGGWGMATVAVRRTCMWAKARASVGHDNGVDSGSMGRGGKTGGWAIAAVVVRRVHMYSSDN